MEDSVSPEQTSSSSASSSVDERACRPTRSNIRLMRSRFSWLGRSRLISSLWRSNVLNGNRTLLRW